MVRATDFLKRHFEVPVAKVSKMTYTSGVLKSKALKTKRILHEKEIKTNESERPCENAQ